MHSGHSDQIPISAPGRDHFLDYLAAIHPGSEPKCASRKGVEWHHDATGKTPPIECWYVYDAGTFWHYFTLGLSDLYEKSDPASDLSGWGFELSIRLEKTGIEAPFWPIAALDEIAAAVLDGAAIAPGVSFRTTRGPEKSHPIDGYLALLDPQIGTLPMGPFGEVSVVLLVGLDESTMAEIKDHGSAALVQEITDDPDRWITRTGGSTPT